MQVLDEWQGCIKPAREHGDSLDIQGKVTGDNIEAPDGSISLRRAT